MKSGNNEYRIFNNLNIKTESGKKEKSYIEERIDLYIFPLNLEKSLNERFGLKFRNVSMNNNNNFSVRT